MRNCMILRISMKNCKELWEKLCEEFVRGTLCKES